MINFMIQFHVTYLFLYPLKTENLAVFCGYRKRPGACNG